MTGRLGLLVVVALVAGACASQHKYDPLPVPDAAPGAPVTSTTRPPDFDGVVLPPVRGTTTTTVAMGPGPATIAGRVDGPDGPVPGAVVRLERLVGDGSARLDVPTAADGTWNASGVLAGRYRIRAWLAPTFAMTRAQVVFVEWPGAKPVILRVDRFEGIRIDSVMEPRPPVVDEPANLKVRVAVRQVDDQGVVRSVAQPGVSVTLSGTGQWSVSSANPSVTDATGSVTFAMTCRSPGEQPLTATLGTGETEPLDVPACT